MKKLNNKGFLLVETIVVAAFTLSVLIILFVQFKNLINNYNLSYKFNTVDGIYNLKSIENYLSENQSSSVPLNSLLKDNENNYLEIITDGNCNSANSLGIANYEFCDELAKGGNFKTVIYTNSDVTELKKYVLKNEPNNVISENMKTFIKRIDKVTSKNRLIAEYNDGTFATVTYGANNDNFTSATTPSSQDNISTDSLLFWGDANNTDNTTSILKNKVSGTDGILNNFENDSSSGYNDGALVFDGVDDFVNIGLSNYDFKNTVSYVAYISVDNYAKKDIDLIGNWEGSGGGLGMTFDNKFYFNGYDGSYYGMVYSNPVSPNNYYTVVGTYDGVNLKMYVDGNFVNSKALSKMTVSSMPVYIGGNPKLTGFDAVVKMKMKSFMIYDRALSEDEVKVITNVFERMYKE